MKLGKITKINKRTRRKLVTKGKEETEKNNEKNSASVVGKKKYLKQNGQPCGDIQKKQRVHHGHD